MSNVSAHARTCDDPIGRSLAPVRHGLAVSLRGTHQPTPALVARQEPVHALEVEPEVGLRARLGERILLRLAGLLQAAAEHDRGRATCPFSQFYLGLLIHS